MSVDRPQYGEYASPEEQRARAGLPPVGQAPVVPTVPQEAQLPASRPAAAPRSRVERMITAALLGVGLINVLTAIPGFLNLSDSLQQSLEMLGGEGTFTNFAMARTWGIVAIVVLLGGYALTVWLSVRRIARGHSSWWVPLVGFVVTMVVVSACISVPMFTDPAFTQSLLTPPAR